MLLGSQIAFPSNELSLKPESTKMLMSKVAGLTGTKPLEICHASVCLQQSPMVCGCYSAMVFSSYSLSLSKETIVLSTKSSHAKSASHATFRFACAIFSISGSNGTSSDPEPRISKHIYI